MTDRDDPHGHSQTAHILNELQLFGHRPYEDEPDPRPLPDGDRVAGAIADIFDALIGTLAETRLEPDLDDLLWSTVNLFHRSAERVERELDDNEQAQRRSQREQDGSEVASGELENPLSQGLTLIERREAHELMREVASDLYRTHTGSAWRPRHGSLVNRRALTAAVVDSRDFIAARRRAETEVMVPAGTKVAFTGGKECNATDAIFAFGERLVDGLPGDQEKNETQSPERYPGPDDRPEVGLDQGRRFSTAEQRGRDIEEAGPALGEERRDERCQMHWSGLLPARVLQLVDELGLGVGLGAHLTLGELEPEQQTHDQGEEAQTFDQRRGDDHGNPQVTEGLGLPGRPFEGGRSELTDGQGRAGQRDRGTKT